jgi:hypothetical protein
MEMGVGGGGWGVGATQAIASQKLGWRVRGGGWWGVGGDVGVGGGGWGVGAIQAIAGQKLG